MSVRSPFRTSATPPPGVWSRRARFRLLLALLLLLPVAFAGEFQLELPLSPSATLEVGGSPQAELAAFSLGLLAGSPPMDSPARQAANSSATRLARSEELETLRGMQPLGLTPEALHRYLLTHTAPPDLDAGKAKLAIAALPAEEQKLLRDHKSELRKMNDALRKLYRAAKLEDVLRQHAKTLQESVQAYRNAFPGDYPAERLFDLSGELQRGGPVVLIPSLIASTPLRFQLPLENRPPIRVSLLPIGPDGAPLPALASRQRFEEVGAWVLEPVFNRFRRELAEVTGSAAPASSQFMRALYLAEQQDSRPDEVVAARRSTPPDRYPMVQPMEKLLTQWLVRRTKMRPLSQLMPELLEQTLGMLYDRSEIPKLADGGFERWNGAVPETWSTEVVEPAQGVSRPSEIARVKGERKGSYALMLSGDFQTNEWQGLFSEPLKVIPGDRVAITGRLRSTNVQSLGKRVTAAHLEARVVNRDGAVVRRVLSREFVGTSPWEMVKLEFVAPAGADRLQIGCVLAMVGELIFDDITFSLQRPGVRHFLFNGGFEELYGNAPESWQVVVNTRLTQSGPTTASRWELDRNLPPEGKAALKLAGDAQTSQWLEVRSPVMGVTPGQRVTVGALMRSRGVQLDPRQHRHANLVLTFVNFGGADVQTVESPVLEGSRDWAPIELEAVAPIEATGVRVGILLTMTGELWVDDVHLARR